MAAVSGVKDMLHQILTGHQAHDVEASPLEVWDKGVFINELQRIGLMLTTDRNGNVNGDLATKTGLKHGTYEGTRLALTEIYSLIEECAASRFDSTGSDPIIPQQRTLQQKRDIYQWSKPEDKYPPHLESIPSDHQETNPNVGRIFDVEESKFVRALAAVFSFTIPDQISHKGAPYKGPTLEDVYKYNIEHKSPNTDIMGGENIGFNPDWYTDARFAQQHLSGVNPSTIAAAPTHKVEEYIAEAKKQGLAEMEELLKKGEDLFIQDYSYFRQATGVGSTDALVNTVLELDNSKDPQKPVATGKSERRYGCASVVIFQLHNDGRLHPLAITIDYKSKLDDSVTIFNKRLSPADDRICEKQDWPWRYAKTCAQVSDWARHEIAVHLVDTHMVEEAIIVATNRTIPDDHLLYQILSPHWLRTLPLNFAARNLLVPLVIARISGFGGPSCYKFIQHAYKNFDFVGKYIPNDLKSRGFDVEDEKNKKKYRNYPYATNMWILWHIIRDFVKSSLETKYRSDADVQKDAYIADWCKEIQTMGQLTTFPTITTVVQLVDAVTMCIHTASTQHTAVNYLQDYYYSFVPSKPPALCSPLPTTISQLQSYTETELTQALPIGTEGAKWKDWLLAAQLPELLSFKVEQKYSLLTYAKSMYNIYKNRTSVEAKSSNEAMKRAAGNFYGQLMCCEKYFEQVSASQTPGTIPYKVLQPACSAVSILI